MTALDIREISKAFGTETVLRNITLSIESGSVATLLGPSGCGKTTLLRIIAGLERADTGRIESPGNIFFDGTENRFLAPQNRRLGFVFQDYGLWPHMSVFENVAFPLKMQHCPKDEIERRVMRSLAYVQLTDHAPKRPHQLSGGQKQRVSIARAIVGEPGIILLDEPLSNLDANLREELGQEIRMLCKRLNLTCVNVTHDRREAQILSDQVALMKDGRIHQVGTPHEVFNAPKDIWAAQFLNAGNLIHIDNLKDIAMTVPPGLNGHKTLLFPRNAITVSQAPTTPSVEITNVVYIEDRFELTADLKGQPIKFFCMQPHAIGSKVHIDLAIDQAIFL